MHHGAQAEPVEERGGERCDEAEQGKAKAKGAGDFGRGPAEFHL